MDTKSVLILKSQKWLKWFCCPHYDSNFPISKNGLCTNCNEQLVLVRDQPIESENLNDIAENNSNFLMPWEIGSSHYYHEQWIQWINPRFEIYNS